MSKLDNRIPPPAVGFIAGVLAWVLAWAWPQPVMPPALHDWGGAVGLLGAGVALAAYVSFKRARTTINPLRPERASSLVVSGVFRFTRNPMYLGIVLAVLGWALHLGAWVALVAPALCGAYLQRFQILPEERVLTQRFGEQFTRYCERVRRWI